MFRYEDVFPLRRGVGSRETPGASPHAPRQVSEGPVLPHLIAKGAAQPDPTQEGHSAASDSDEPPPLIEYDPEIDSWTDVEKILNRAEAQLRRDHLALGALILASQSQDEKEDAKACYESDKEVEDCATYCDDVPVFLNQYDDAETKADLTHFLSDVRNGKLDNPTPMQAQAYVKELRKSRLWAMSFKQTLRQWEITAEELPLLLEGSAAARTFAFYLPEGALSWSTLGAYRCETCYMPLQQQPLAYAHHMLGEPHLTRLQRFVGYLEAIGPSEFLLCKICLKVIDPEYSGEEHNDSKKHKRAKETWLSVPGMAWSAQ